MKSLPEAVMAATRGDFDILGRSEADSMLGAGKRPETSLPARAFLFQPRRANALMYIKYVRLKHFQYHFEVYSRSMIF